MFRVQKAILLLLKLLTKIPRADTFVRRLTSIWFNKGFQPFVWHFGGWLSLWRGLLVNYFHPVAHADIAYFIALPCLNPKATFSSFPHALGWTLFLTTPLLWEKILFKICNLSTLQTTIITAGRWELNLWVVFPAFHFFNTSMWQDKYFIIPTGCPWQVKRSVNLMQIFFLLW